ncbi:hypothetical protein N657DRAFT_581603 [Parathielavia appendiculata]|uniref:Serine hydrolase domain-containing protein n=1 Tax=Parathielavia appendiculata TaxID=2587402 RepID=A0AAN6TSQ1_9PEZI|nr:hypothetical protein N657DRAFT_581603 [Parathielavia appendiculata]
MTKILSSTFRFVLPDAPFLVDRPGPGASSVSVGPFRRWHSDRTIATAFGVPEAKIMEETLVVRDILRLTLEREKDVVGVLAFSQGACLGTALCLDQELNNGLKFAVFICPLFPAVSLGPQKDVEGAVQVPCVHVRGLSDPWKGQGVKLYEKYFVGSRASTLVEFAGAHEVPSQPSDIEKVVDEILRIWEAIG